MLALEVPPRAARALLCAQGEALNFPWKKYSDEDVVGSSEAAQTVENE